VYSRSPDINRFVVRNFREIAACYAQSSIAVKTYNDTKQLSVRETAQYLRILPIVPSASSWKPSRKEVNR
jgi:hypothetical protein